MNDADLGSEEESEMPHGHRTTNRSTTQRKRSALRGLCLLALGLAFAAPSRAQEVDDRAITRSGGAVSRADSPLAIRGQELLGDREEGVTIAGEVTGEPVAEELGNEERRAELPRAGEWGGITRVCAECVEPRSQPTNDRGLNEVVQGGIISRPRPGTQSACQGHNTGGDYVDNISMGGPMVAVAWVPTASATITAVEVFTGEAVAPSRLAIWSDDSSPTGKPLSALAWTGSFNSASAKGWQGASLTEPLSVAQNVRYWVVWDPTGGEQASVTDSGVQQTYWGSYNGDVEGGANWFGPFSHSDHRWKFRTRCGNGPCDGHNHSDTAHLDNVSMGGSVVAIAWTPAVTGTIARIELFTGEVAAVNRVALWSDGGGSPGQPLSWSSSFNTTFGKGWQGGDLQAPVSVAASSRYWVVWDPVPGQQAPVTNGGIQQTYWGSWTGDVQGGTIWNGPYSFSDRRWKFRVFCQDGPCDGNNDQGAEHLDPVFMGGPMVGIRWVPANDKTVTGVEVFTGEASGSNAVGIWSDNNGQPGAPLGFSNPFGTALAKSWQGAPLTNSVYVNQGQTYWVVWDPSGGEQAAVTASGIQQTYWGNSGGTVSGGGSWFGPFSFPDRRWKFRLLCGRQPCDGNNFANTYHLDNVFTGGPMIGIRWQPAANETLQRIEVFTGEAAASNAIGIWSSTGGVSPQPLAPLSTTAPFTTAVTKDWQGADLIVPLSVSSSSEYWLVWDPGVGQQSALTDSQADTQQTYWGSSAGTVSGGASWFGPFSFPDRRYKFRMFCTCPVPSTRVGVRETGRPY